MIIGIGNDIMSVTDIKESIKCSNRFLQRVFCLAEQEYCDRQPNKFQHFAGCFAVKEAVMKALGTGWNNGIQWNHIELTHYPSGKPDILMHYQAKKQSEILNVKRIYVSISHTEQYAAAIAVLEE